MVLVRVEMSGDDAVAATAGGFKVLGFEAQTDTFRRVVGQVEGAVEPPPSVVVPKVAVRPFRLLTAGQGRCVGCHEDVVV